MANNNIIADLTKRENLYLLALVGTLCWFIERGGDLLAEQYQKESEKMQTAVTKNTEAIQTLTNVMKDFSYDIERVNNRIDVSSERGKIIVERLDNEDKKLWQAIEDLKK